MGYPLFSDGLEQGNINVYVYVYIMSRLVNLSDSVYEELTRMKRAKNASYSEVIQNMLTARHKTKRNETLQDLIEWAEDRACKYKGPKEKTDHDLVAYGVSRDSA